MRRSVLIVRGVVLLTLLLSLSACPETGAYMTPLLILLAIAAAAASSDRALPNDYVVRTEPVQSVEVSLNSIKPPAASVGPFYLDNSRVKLPSVPSGTESFAATIATNGALFVDSLVNQLSTNFDSAVAQGFLSAKEAKVSRKRMNLQAKVLKRDFDKFGRVARSLVLAQTSATRDQYERALRRVVFRMKKKGKKGPFGKPPFKNKAPNKEGAAKSRVVIARQQRSVSGLFINFFQSLASQLTSAATTQTQVDLVASVLAALQTALEKDIQQNEKAAGQALKKAYKAKGKIKDLRLIARSYSGEDVYLTGGARATVSVDVTLDVLSSVIGTFGGQLSAAFINGLELTTTVGSDGTFVARVSKSGAIVATITTPGSSEPVVKIRGKIDVKKGTIELDILEVRDPGDYTGGGIRHRITTLSAASGSECNSFAALVGGQGKLTPDGMLSFTFEDDINRPTGDVVNILSGSKDDTNKQTLAQVDTSGVTFPTDSFTVQLSSAQCSALNAARDFNVGVPQSPVDNTKTGDFTELGNGCSVVC